MKKIIFIITLIVSLGLVANFKYVNKPTIKGVNTQTIVKQINVEQKISPDKTTISQFKTYTINSGSTALDLLKQNIPIVTKGEEINAYVTSINNIAAEDSKKQFWSFYINDKQASVGAGSYKLNNGDKIEWKLETY